MDGPTQHQKLTVDTEYIARASRTLAVMTLVRQAAANEVAVPSRSESVKWINEAELDERWMDGQSLLFVFWCIWCRRGGVVATVSNSAQTPEELCNSQDIAQASHVESAIGGGDRWDTRTSFEPQSAGHPCSISMKSRSAVHPIPEPQV